MGCAPSNEVQQSPRKGTIRRGSIFKREKVSLKLGKSVALSNTYPQIIFLFGGPGSGKGKLLSDLSETFGLTLLNMECLLLESLYKILEEEEDYDPLRRTNAIAKLVRAQPELLRVDYVLKQLQKKINSMDKNRCFIVDFMPNLKYILLSSVFVKECSNELRNFENHFAVSFAVHLSVPPDKYNKKKQAECAEAQPNKNPNEQTSQAKVQSDEADTSRTSKRAVLFHNSLKHFLDYFQKHDRLVTLDVSSGDKNLIWERTCELFDEVMMSHQKLVNTVILFAFGDDEFDKMGIGRFEVQHISLCDIVDYPKDEPEKLIQLLCKKIDQSHPTQTAFAVNLSETSISQDLAIQEKRKGILFYDIEHCNLEQHLIQKKKTNDKPVVVQAVSSLENEVYLFLPNIPKKFCFWMAETMRKIKA